MRGSMLSDVQNTSPFGETTAALLEGSSPLGQLVQTLGRSLSDGSSQGDDSEIELDSRDDSLLGEQVHETLSTVR